LIFLSSSIALPLAFFWVNTEMGSQSNYSFPEFNIPNINIPNSNNFITNFIYLYNFNLGYILVFIILIGLIIYFQKKEKKEKLNCNILLAISLLINFIIINFLSFDYLVEVERNNYQKRIILEILIFLSPFIFLFFEKLIQKVKIQNNSIKLIILFFVGIILTTSLYTSYPRIDNFNYAHGFSISSYDIEAVQKIENLNKNNKNYVVLANQQVGVAALKEFGFKRYLKSKEGKEIYFYSIPTGEKLYNLYLKILETKDKKYIKDAMKTSQAKKLYLILNDYWWGFAKLKEELKLISDNLYIIKDNNKEKIIIFEFFKQSILN